MELSSNIVFDTRDILCKFISTKLKCEKWFKPDLESNRNTSYCLDIGQPCCQMVVVAMNQAASGNISGAN